MRVRVEPKGESRNVQTCMILLVTILSLFFLAGFVIVGAVLMTLDVSVTSQLVTQYNGYVMAWNDGIKTSFDRFTFQGQLGNYNKVSLQKKSIIDPVPNEKNVMTYVPIQYETAGSIPVLTGEFRFNDASSLSQSMTLQFNWDTFRMQVDLPLFGIKKEILTECDEAKGHYTPQTQECQTYWVLSGACVLFDSRTQKIARVGTDFGCTPGQDGPYPNQWRVGTYRKVDRAPHEQSRKGPADTAPQSTGTFMIRELHDPFVRYNEMTFGQLNFRSIRTQPYFGLGLAFLIMSVVPFVFVLILGCFGCVTLVKLIPTLFQKGPTDAQHGLLNQDEYLEEPEGREDRQYPLEYGNSKQNY